MAAKSTYPPIALTLEQNDIDTLEDLVCARAATLARALASSICRREIGGRQKDRLNSSPGVRRDRSRSYSLAMK